MKAECQECGRPTSQINPDGWYFLCPLHDGGPTVSALGVPDALLSARELQVALYAVEGYTNAEIALDLGLSPNYVKNVVSMVIRKLHLRSRRELIRITRRWGLY